MALSLPSSGTMESALALGSDSCRRGRYIQDLCPVCILMLNPTDAAMHQDTWELWRLQGSGGQGLSYGKEGSGRVSKTPLRYFLGE
jgi:hypothetical protein